MRNLHKTYPFEPLQLNYTPEELSPKFSPEAVKVHYNGHYMSYINNLNAVLQDYPEYRGWTLDEFFSRESELHAEARNPILRNAGGIFNHETFFSHLKPEGKPEPEGELADAVIEFFGSFEAMKEEFIAEALKVFGSGYAFLVVTPQSWIQIITQSNQDTLSEKNYTIIAAADMWEHAYYLDYQNKKRDYLENLWELFDWEQAEKTFETINEKNKKFEFGF